MDQNEYTPTKQSFTSVFAIIEKVQELRWTLHLAMVVLFADLMLVWRGGRGIIYWSTSTDQLLANAGFLITGVLAFGVLMSFVMPLAGWLFRFLIWSIEWGRLVRALDRWLGWDTPGSNSTQTERDDRPYGAVRAGEFYDLALRKGDKVLLDIYETHVKNKWAQASVRLASGQMVFSVLVLAIFDYRANWLGIEGTTVLQALVALLGELGERVLVLVSVILAFSALWWAWFTEDDPDWIYYPPLYKEKEQRKRDIEEEQKRRIEEQLKNNRFGSDDDE